MLSVCCLFSGICLLQTDGGKRWRDRISFPVFEKTKWVRSTDESVLQWLPSWSLLLRMLQMWARSSSVNSRSARATEMHQMRKLDNYSMIVGNNYLQRISKNMKTYPEKTKKLENKPRNDVLLVQQTQAKRKGNLPYRWLYQSDLEGILTPTGRKCSHQQHALLPLSSCHSQTYRQRVYRL